MSSTHHSSSPFLSHRGYLKREQIRRVSHEWGRGGGGGGGDDDDSSLSDIEDDEADFMLARRENSLCVDVLDALGSSTAIVRGPSMHRALFRLSQFSQHFTDSAWSVAAAAPECDSSPSLRRRRRSDMPHAATLGGSGRLPRSMGATMTTSAGMHSVIGSSGGSRSCAMLRKAGIFEFPCAADVAFDDVVATITLLYRVAILSKRRTEVKLRVKRTGMNHGSFCVYVGRHDDEDDDDEAGGGDVKKVWFSRVWMRLSVKDSFRVDGESFDAFCTAVFNELIMKRQVIRPYYGGVFR